MARARKPRRNDVDQLAAKAGAIVLEGVPLPIAKPLGLEDVAAWAERVRAERLNDTGRAAVDVLELYVRAAVGWSSVDVLRKLGPVIDKLFRIGLQADQHEAQRYVLWLRKRAEAAEQAEEDFGGIH